VVRSEHSFHGGAESTSHLRAWRRTVVGPSLTLGGRCSGAAVLPAVGRERSARWRQVHHPKGCAQGPLHMAAFKGHASTMKVLVQLGADKEAKDVEGRTPLHWAKTRRHSGPVKALTQLGTDVNAPHPSSVLADVLKFSLVPLLLLFDFYVFNRLFTSVAPSSRVAAPRAPRWRVALRRHSSEHAVSSSGRAGSLGHCWRRCDSWLRPRTTATPSTWRTR
jgi:hypothetical protein